MDTDTRFRSFRIFFLIVGNPLMGDGQFLAYRLYSVAVVIIGYGCWMGQVVAIFKHLDERQQMLEAARNAIPVMTSIWSDIFIRSHKHSVEKLIRLTEQFIWEDCPERDNGSGSLTMAGRIARIPKVMVYTMWLVLGPHSVYMAFRSIGSEKLGLSMWTPFDARPSPVHEITVIIQMYSTVINLANYLGFVGLYATLVAIGCTQLQKLQVGLKNFRKEKMLIPGNEQQNLFKPDTEQENRLKPDTEQQNLFKPDTEQQNLFKPDTEQQNYSKPDTEQENLHECVRLHQRVLSFMRAMEDTLSIMVLGHFLIIIGAICFTAISIVAFLGESGEALQIVFVFGCMVMQLAIYCWFGEELTYQAATVKQAAWECEWVGAPLQQQRTLIFIMAAANQEVALTAGGFSSVSLDTMIKVLNQAISFTMFLANVRTDTGSM